METDGSLGLYFHVPFCASKCPYCDFYSHCDPARIPAYTAAVRRELDSGAGFRAFTDGGLWDRRVCSAYFGGGTPSSLPAAELRSILDAARVRFDFAPDAEITVECNPSLPEPAAYFAALAAAGVNRISLGLQSAVDGERRRLGRRADAAAAADCIAAAKRAGIRDISLDLMLGIPGQTAQSLRESLSFCEAREIGHLSVYLLKLEENTFFYKNRKKLDLPDEDAAADLYLEACDFLEARGWRHYEISNFCRDGRVGRHNLRYWQGGDYLGIGPAAHSLYGENRFYYEADLEAFLGGTPCAYEGAGGGAAERLMLALRTDLGLELPAFTAAYAVSAPEKLYAQARSLAAHGLARFDGARLSLTDAGMLVSNAAILSLLELL